MLCFGPCHARSSVIEAMIARQQKIGLVVSKVLRNDWKIDLKLIVNRRYVIPFPNGDASGNLYRTVPHVDGMILNAVQERQLSAYEPKIFEFIVHNKYCPAILLTQLYMGEFQQNSKYEKARQQTSVSVDIGFLKKKLEEISRSPTISKTFLESIS